MKQSSQAATIDGAITGRVTYRNAASGEHPRSRAASSSDRSKLTSRADITTDAKHMAKVVCASTIVVIPRPMSSEMNNNSRESPVITSGITSGA